MARFPPDFNTGHWMHIRLSAASFLGMKAKRTVVFHFSTATQVFFVQKFERTSAVRLLTGGLIQFFGGMQ